MNIAVIFAGGSGIRMNSAGKPKQFLKAFGKEIIIHTLDVFEGNPEIDAIAIACIEPGIPYLKKLLEKYNIRKVKWIVPGGETCEDSIYNGLDIVQQNCSTDSVVLIHDGVRPLITDKLIADCIAGTNLHRSAITVTPEIETVVNLDGTGKIIGVTERSKCWHAKAPQCFILKDIWEAYRKAKDEGINTFIDSATLMQHYGKELYTVQGSYDNIKITTPSDFYVFQALYQARENSQILGL
jgi:2-C-methyl-D-erythritol 4-phosphate cytidylyltransferase